MINYLKGIVATCKLILWSHKYKMLDTEIRLKKLEMSNSGQKLALYLRENKDILNYVKGQSDYKEDFDNLIEFLNTEDGWSIVAEDIK